ncbi:MAG: MBL fold metallo-hydrolase [Chloroflexi bacterium]|nr:MBL fold metallo-hydrolase [Chloroflexota bacterium]
MAGKRTSAFVVMLALFLGGCTAAAPTAPPPPKAPDTATATAVPKPATKPSPPAAAPSAATPAGKPVTAPAAAETSLQWFGHATFLLTSAEGAKVLLDPFGPQVGYTVPVLRAIDAVTVTHEHGDHNNVALAGEGAAVLRGLTGDGWANIDQTMKGTRIRTVATFHDAREGAERGRNAVFIFEVDGMKLAHLGDLGHELTPAQVSAVGPVDVVMVPVGGFFTIDAATAAKVVGQLSAKAIIPMHYRTPKFSPNNAMTGVDDFLKDKKVERLNSTTYKFNKAALPATATVYVLNYE